MTDERSRQADRVEVLASRLAAEAKDWRHNAYSRVTFARMHDDLVRARTNQGDTHG